MAAPTLNEFRPAFAGLFAKTGDAVLNRQKQAVPLMKEQAPAGQAFGLGISIPLNATNVGILMLDLLDGSPLQEIAERLPQLWKAAYTQKAGPVCPISGAATVGDLFVALLDRPAVRDRLRLVEIEKETLTVSAAWKGDQRPSVFHPYRTPEDWKRAVLEARRKAVHTVEVPAVVFAGVAELMLRYTLPQGEG
jgi:hypothetical protein